MFSKADNYMNEGCFQPASSCDKYPYIGDLYLLKSLILLDILWNTEAAILVTIHLMLHFMEFHWQSRFCINEYIAKFFTKIICNIFYWSLWCSFASNTADFEISLFNLTHKVPPSSLFEIRKSLKRIPSLAYTEMDQTKYRVSSMFAFRWIIWMLLHVFTCT